MNLQASLDMFGYGTSSGMEKAWDSRGRGRKKCTTPKCQRALASHVPVTKEKRGLATVNEAIVAKLVGGFHTKDSEEFDVLLPGRKIGIEVKSVFPGVMHSKITMHGSSLERKIMFLDAEKYKKAYTVIFDMRDHSVYVAKGLGSFRFDKKSLQSGKVQLVNLKSLASMIK